MPTRHLHISSRAALLGGAALIALTAGAAARDLPATAAGAKTLTDFIATYAGKAAATAPGLVVTPEGTDYAVALDLAALTAPYKDMGFSYDSGVLNFKVFQQDDGAWRLEQNGFTPLSAHAKQTEAQGGGTMDVHMDASGYKNVSVIDPALAWIRSGAGSADKATVNVRGPGVVEDVDLGPLKADAASKAGADGAVTTMVKEAIDSVVLHLNVDPKAANPKASPDAKPVEFTARSTGATVDVGLDGLKPRTLLDIWAFLVAHPTRPERAANIAALKNLMTVALAAQTSVKENIGAQQLTVQAPQGPFVFEGVKVAVGGANAGAASRFEEHFSTTKISLPPGLVPDMYKDLTPTSFDIGFKLSGFDLAAAGAEWIADLHLDGDGPPVSKEDSDKVFAKLIGSGTVVLDIPPSHLLAPHLDIAFEGKVTYVNHKPTGAVTVRVRDFDSTVAALKGLGPDAEKQMVPMIAMAKGLAKTDPDGVLTWVGEVGADSIVKVNGLPLGKSPF